MFDVEAAVLARRVDIEVYIEWSQGMLHTGFCDLELYIPILQGKVVQCTVIFM